MQDSRYLQATEFLPLSFRPLARLLPPEKQEQAEEFRLRVGQPLSVLLPLGEESLGSLCVQREDLEQLCEKVTDFSRYAANDAFCQGYYHIRGGFRLGICGTLVVREGKPLSMPYLSSLALRIAKEHIGLATPLLPRLYKDGRFQSTLIVSPPGGGKTSLLRDLIRSLSDAPQSPLRVGVVDERGELAACYHGIPQLQLGKHTDVLDACPKSIGIPLLLRAMNPQVLAVEEILTEADWLALEQAIGCGVALLATMHGDASALIHKPLYQRNGRNRLFSRIIYISQEQGIRHYRVEEVA